jgi:predicted enzyme related to lactoylglutathione lyase
MFCCYALRTTDAVAARAFYADALGLMLPDGMAEGSALEAWPLHERARAAGAPAHWLGMLAVNDVESTVARMLALGGERLGPTVQAKDGASFATLRDPFGSVIALRAGTQIASASPVAWHQLHTRDADGAWAMYEQLFNWSHEQTLQVSNLEGGYRMFAWQQGGELVGAIGNTARWPGVHTHWLFFMPVRELDAAAARVRALGGKTLEAFTLQSGMRLMACEDPQGAAFGLAQT